jgi:hypothetical protein
MVVRVDAGTAATAPPSTTGPSAPGRWWPATRPGRGGPRPATGSRPGVPARGGPADGGRDVEGPRAVPSLAQPATFVAQPPPGLVPAAAPLEDRTRSAHHTAPVYGQPFPGVVMDPLSLVSVSSFTVGRSHTDASTGEGDAPGGSGPARRCDALPEELWERVTGDTRTRHGGGDGRVHGPPVDRTTVSMSATGTVSTGARRGRCERRGRCGTRQVQLPPRRSRCGQAWPCEYVAVRPGCIAAVSLPGLPNGQEACWAGLSPASGGASSRHPAAPPRQALARISADARPGQGCTLDLPVCPPACASTSQRWPSVRMYTSRRPSELRFPFHQWRSILTY